MDTKDYLRKMAGIQEQDAPVSKILETEELERLQVLAGMREKNWGVVSEKTSTLHALSDGQLIELANREGLEKSVVKDAEGGLANRNKLIDILSDHMGEDTMEEALSYSLEELQEMEMEGEVPSCPACDGPGVPLGSLGQVDHFRCRNCGIDFNSDKETAVTEQLDLDKDRHSKHYKSHMATVSKHLKDLKDAGHEVVSTSTGGGRKRHDGSYSTHETRIKYKTEHGHKTRMIVGNEHTLNNRMHEAEKVEVQESPIEAPVEAVVEDKVNEANGVVLMSNVPSTKVVDNQSELENRMGVDVMRDNKIKVPEKVKSQVKQRIAELKESIAQYDDKGYNDTSVKKQAIECMEQIMTNLESGDLEGFKEAQIFFQTLMSPLTDLMPAALVNFLASGQ